MEISNSHLAAYGAEATAPRPGASFSRGSDAPPSAPGGPASGADEYHRRPPAEQVLEGELLNDRRQQARANADEQRQARQRYQEQMQQIKSASPQAARALEAYLSTAGVAAAGFSDYSPRLDVYA